MMTRGDITIERGVGDHSRDEADSANGCPRGVDSRDPHPLHVAERDRDDLGDDDGLGDRTARNARDGRPREARRRGKKARARRVLGA